MLNFQTMFFYQLCSKDNEKKLLLKNVLAIYRIIIINLIVLFVTLTWYVVIEALTIQKNTLIFRNTKKIRKQYLLSQ